MTAFALAFVLIVLIGAFVLWTAWNHLGPGR